VDHVALRLANALVGNAEAAAALEISVLGPELRVEADSARVAAIGPVRLALTDAPGEAPRPLDADRSHLLRRGQTLRVGTVDGVSVAYVAVEGGFDLPPFMGSLSTYTRAGLGGLDGRKLREGDALPLKLAAAPERTELRLAAPFDYGSGPVRVVLGPQDDYFSAAGLDAFLSGTYAVTKEADRMGFRLEGPTIAHNEKGADIASDGIAPGAIQVPAAGQPIILLADRQTVGGYTKIAAVISADLPRVGRLLPGKTLQFAAVSVAEAEQLVLEYVRKHVPEPGTAPLAGNSIATDRHFLARDMPELNGYLHYRMVDVSSVKELCRRWYPRIYFGQPEKGLAHRALADIHESIRELRYYRRTAFVPAPGPSTGDIAAIAEEVAAPDDDSETIDSAVERPSG